MSSPTETPTPTGWNPSPVEALVPVAVERLGTHWVNPEDPEHRPRLVLSGVWHHLKDAARTVPDLTPAAARGWLVVLVAAPATEYRRLRDLLSPGIWAAPERQIARDRWLALGEIGPLAYAAGLPLDEAEAHATTGTPDPVRLRLLAGLRGWAPL